MLLLAFPGVVRLFSQSYRAASLAGHAMYVGMRMSLLDGKEGGEIVIRGCIWRWCLGIVR